MAFSICLEQCFQSPTVSIDAIPVARDERIRANSRAQCAAAPCSSKCSTFDQPDKYPRPSTDTRFTELIRRRLISPCSDPEHRDRHQAFARSAKADSSAVHKLAGRDFRPRIKRSPAGPITAMRFEEIAANPCDIRVFRFSTTRIVAIRVDPDTTSGRSRQQ
jgi:hypothetical protein